MSLGIFVGVAVIVFVLCVAVAADMYYENRRDYGENEE